MASGSGIDQFLAQSCCFIEIHHRCLTTRPANLIRLSLLILPVS